MKLAAVSLVAAPLLAELHQRAFTTHLDWDADYYQKLLALPTTRGLYASDDDTPLGFVLWQQTVDVAEIITIAVRRVAQKQGVGQALLAGYEAMLIGEGVSESLLDVAEDNAPAIALYRKMGYAEVHRRKGYYQTYQNGQERRVDALVLRKML